MALKLYEKQFTHYAPKDSSSGLQGYMIAESEQIVFEHMDGIYGWTEDYDDEDPASYVAEIMENRGNWDDELSDLYYGADRQGWSEGVEISDADAAVLIRLEIAYRLPA